MCNPNIPTLATPQCTCTLATPIASLSCEASPYSYISRAVFVAFMFPEGLITESARNVTFHLLLFLFSHSTTVVCTRMASSKPLPQRTPNHGDYEDRSRARREWSGAPCLPPSGGPSPLMGRTPLQCRDQLTCKMALKVASIRYQISLTQSNYTGHRECQVYIYLFKCTYRHKLVQVISTSYGNVRRCYS